MQAGNTLYFPCRWSWVAKMSCFCWGLLAAAVIGIGALHQESGFPNADWEEQLLGGGLLLVALWLGVTPFLLFYRVWTSKAGLWIDDRGLVDRTSFFAVGRIAWSEIADMWLLRVQRQDFLGLEMVDGAHFRRRLSRYQRIVLGMNRPFSDADYFLSLSPLQAMPEDVIAIIEKHVPGTLSD